MATMAVLFSPVGPGKAIESPVSEPEPPEVMTPQTPKRTVSKRQPGKMPEQAVSDASAEEPDAAPAQEPAAQEAAWAPVPESEAVEDTYFQDVIFLGDSRTEGFSLYSGLKEGKYFYSVGATVESVFSKNVWTQEDGSKVPLLDAMAKESCGKIYVMLGVNELGWVKVETFQNQYAKVIDRLREDHPDAQIVLQSILPVSAKQDAKKTYVNNQRIQTYNEAIMALAEEKDCAYVNVAEAVTGEDGCLRPELTFDGVHLNTQGCRIWLDYLRTHSV
ncbi:GDSL-type esterase/lipase family protein [uncultured Oscillibacter sp.]|uniref:GDSL-type esterase/lipase family protein n=1 Tax=uncultured Oscillibacter sp. TaxID=876091 RepID=UPI002804CD22|nr:GDSL-type esterase/lipase family protein [uncultured Oscillibacter sp.]